MDFLRSCYTTTMQFDEEGQITAKVRWYWASSGAKLWDGRNSFCSAVWDSDPYATVGLGELWNEPRVYSKGEAPYPSPGKGCFCGPADWFADGAPSDAPPLTRGPAGQPFCCPGKPGLYIGGSSVVRLRYESSGGLLLGGGALPPPATCAAWHTGVQPGRSFKRNLTGTFWPKIADTGSSATFQDPLNPNWTALFFQTGGICIPGFNGTTASLHQSFPVVGNNTLQFRSGNNTTGQSVWQAAGIFPIYPGEFFTLQMF